MESFENRDFGRGKCSRSADGMFTSRRQLFDHDAIASLAAASNGMAVRNDSGPSRKPHANFA